MALSFPFMLNIINSPVAVKGVENEESLAAKRLKCCTDNGLILLTDKSPIPAAIAVKFWTFELKLFCEKEEKFTTFEVFALRISEKVFPVTNKLPDIDVFPVTLKPDNSNCLISIILTIADNAVKLDTIREFALILFADIFFVWRSIKLVFFKTKSSAVRLVTVAFSALKL